MKTILFCLKHVAICVTYFVGGVIATLAGLWVVYAIGMLLHGYRLF